MTNPPELGENFWDSKNSRFLHKSLILLRKTIGNHTGNKWKPIGKLQGPRSTTMGTPQENLRKRQWGTHRKPWGTQQENTIGEPQGNYRKPIGNLQDVQQTDSKIIGKTQ